MDIRKVPEQTFPSVPSLSLGTGNSLPFPTSEIRAVLKGSEQRRPQAPALNSRVFFLFNHLSLHLSSTAIQQGRTRTSIHFTGEETLLEKCNLPKDTQWMSARGQAWTSVHVGTTLSPEFIAFHSTYRLFDRDHSAVPEAAVLLPSAHRENYAQPLQLLNGKVCRYSFRSRIFSFSPRIPLLLYQYEWRY